MPEETREQTHDQVSDSAWFNTEPIVEVAYLSRAKARRRLAALLIGVTFIGLGLLLPFMIPERPQRPLPPIVVPELAAPAPEPSASTPTTVAAVLTPAAPAEQAAPAPAEPPAPRRHLRPRIARRSTPVRGTGNHF